MQPVTAMPSHQHVFQIGGLAVDPASQGTGVGRDLVEAAAQDCSRRGARKLTLRVLGPNVIARRLYERCGFIVEGVLKEEDTSWATATSTTYSWPAGSCRRIIRRTIGYRTRSRPRCRPNSADGDGDAGACGRVTSTQLRIQLTGLTARWRPDLSAPASATGDRKPSAVAYRSVAFG